MILLDKFRVEQVLGVGGMGKVVKASHIYLQHPVAIKVLLPQMLENESTVQRFLREAQATSKLKSEHIARVTDACSLPDGTPIMVMEYLQGNDLNQILRHHGPQSPNVVVDLMLQACEGIAEAHAAGIVHRDIKPSNFFITLRPDGSMLLKILDFGISKAPVGYSDDLTNTQTQIGTPTYMAPEQMKQARNADTRSDIWSLGVVMYQLLTGRPPFEAESYAALVLKVGLEPPAPMHVQLPPGLGEIILRCLEKEPRNRHASVGDLARLLSPFATDPLTAGHAAERAQRILTARGSAPTVNLTGHTRLTTPVPLSPAQLTPGTWPPQSQSGTANPAGQITYKTQGTRGWIIAGIASLVIVAGAGGWIAARQLQSDSPVAASPSSDSKTTDSKTTDSKTTDSKATDSKTIDSKTIDSKATDSKTTDSKATESKVTDSKAGWPYDSKSAGSKATDSKTTDSKTTDSKTTDSKTTDSKTTDSKTTDSKTTDSKTTDSKAITKTADTKPVVKTVDKPVTKPITKPITKPANDDLFDSRH
jgi:serine/threonine-protein kinase